MAKYFTIEKAEEFVGKVVTVKGWVFNKRSSGGIIFLQVRDGTGFIQATVVEGEAEKGVFKTAEILTLESSIIVKGNLKADKRAPGGYEIAVLNLEIVNLAPDNYPIGKKEHGIDFLLSQRHLWLRSKRQWAILQIRSKLIKAIEDFYRQEDFTRIDTPIITPNSCEGTTTLFEIDYFGEPAYLSQSGQLYLEAAIASFGRVYDLAPVFRAEKSKTRRHLIEFWMTNAEVAFCDLEEIIKIQEKMILFLLEFFFSEASKFLQILKRNITHLEKIKPPFERITYDQALKVLKKLGSDIKDGMDFGNDDETLLMNYYKQPLFVTHYPAKVKAFYMKKDKNDQERVLCCDLLAPEGYGEIIGGGEREDDYEVLFKSMKKHDLLVRDYQWYLDLRRYGSVPHAGFGLGVERFMAWICGTKHVRETIPFPRLLNRYRP